MVLRQCSLSFDSSAPFNLGSTRQRQRGRGREEGRKRQSMISPSACFNSVSCRSSDPFVMQSHGKSDWAHYPLLSTDTGSGKREAPLYSSHHHCSSLGKMAACQASLSNLALAASFPPFGGNKYVLSFPLQQGVVGNWVSELKLLAHIVWFNGA